MSTFLCIGVRFLDPCPAFHGRTDGGEPEWPPSPLRLFQALVAAATSRWRKPHFQEYAYPALEWLQRQGASIIVAPSHHVGMPVRMAVPNNDLDVVATGWAKRHEPKKQPNELKTMKTVRPTRLLVNKDDQAAVHYLFSLGDDGCPHLEVLSAAARSITHLGWGIDMVAANATVISEADSDKLPGERWRPTEDSAANSYRVPIPGTLDALIQKHHAFLNRLGPDGFKPVPPLSAFRVVGYRRATDVPGRRYVAFKLLHPVVDRSAWFSPTRANCVAAMTRHATATAAVRQPQDWIDSYVHGHRSPGNDTKPRFSYLPLPTIEHRGQGGRVIGGIRRVLLAEPLEAPASYLLWARQMLPGQFLIDVKSGERKAMLAPLNDSDWVLRQYTAYSDAWATVTPVVLPGCDEGKFARAEKLFFKALAHAGYSSAALADLEFRNVSFWPSGDLAVRFQRPDYLKKDRWTVYHVRLRWRQRISGPLAIGAGRHCGLGLFAATRPGVFHPGDEKEVSMD